MATADYRPNEAGWDALGMSPDLLAACVAEAERGKAYAVSISPQDSGEYARSFVVTPTTLPFRRGPRVAARLENTADHAAAVEFGNRRSKARRVLGRTAAYLAGGGGR